MSSPATVKMESMLSEFSANLLATKDADKQSQNSSDQNNSVSDNEAMAGNFNLNKVLTKIRDNGSAYIDNRKSNIEKNKQYKKTIQSDNNEYTDTDIGSYTVHKQSNDLKDEITDDELHLSSNKKVDIKFLNYVSRKQLLLLTGFTVVVIGISMYMMDSHVDNSIKSKIYKTNTDTPVLLPNIHRTMDGEIARNPDQMMVSEMKVGNQNQLTLISDNVSALKNEIQDLRHQLNEVKAKLKPGDDISKNSSDGSASVDNIIIDEPEKLSITESIAKVVSEDLSVPVKIESTNTTRVIKQHSPAVQEEKPAFKVSLVSLSHHDKAKEIIDKLDMTGLSPKIDEILVNGKPIYRVSVSGFTNKQIATEFIQKAANKFGIKGSRIRKI